MSSILKENASRATLYMAFPKKRHTQANTSGSQSTIDTGLGGLLDGVGPTLSDLSIGNLLRCLRA